MKATVCIPWRPQPDRVAAYKRVRSFWAHHGFKVITADSDRAQPFHICEARNKAVKRATTDYVIVADADTIPDIANVHQALTMDGVVWPYTEFRHIAADWVSKSDLWSAPVDQRYKRSVGGIFITRRETYWQLGGMDERFERRWGYEDNAFHLAVVALSHANRVPGVVVSFNHTADRNLTDNPNQHRYQLYKLASGRPELMRELVKR